MTGNTIDLGVGTDTVKFTEISTADTVTVTARPSLVLAFPTKNSHVTLITTGSGADSIVFKDQVSGDTVITTNSGMTRFSS